MSRPVPICDPNKITFHIFPFGSYEPHGKNVPRDIDNVIAQFFATRIQARLTQKGYNTYLYPLTGITLSKEHPVSRMISADTLPFLTYLQSVFHNFCSSIKNDRNLHIILLFNSHGGNIGILQTLEYYINHEKSYNSVKAIFLHLYDKRIIEEFEKKETFVDPHSGNIELSLYSYITGKKIAFKRNSRNYAPFSQFLRFYKSNELSDEHCVLDKKGKNIISASLGEKFINKTIPKIIAIIEDHAKNFTNLL